MADRIRSVLAALCLCGLAPAAHGQAPPAAAEPSSPLTLVDYTDDFDRVWTELQALPEAERADQFQRRFAAILPGFYDPARMSEIGMTPAKYQEYLAKMIANYPDQRPGIQRVSQEFGKTFEPARLSFERELGPMTGYPPVYLVHALGEFDGGTRSLPGGTRLMFGADMIDKLYKETAIQPFFHHELFHLYHGRRFRECDPAWCSLWSEGLAVYVAATLNPGASDAALLLTSPVPLRKAVEGHRAEAICTVRSRLNSTESKDYSAMFTGGGDPISANLPGRFGYYVGYLVAKDLGRTRSLKALAALSPADVQPLIEASLARMSNCP